MQFMIVYFCSTKLRVSALIHVFVFDCTIAVRTGMIRFKYNTIIEQSCSASLRDSKETESTVDGSFCTSLQKTLTGKKNPFGQIHCAI